jgi:MFS family permease
VRLVVGLVLLGCSLPLGLLAFITSPWLACAALLIEGVAAIALDVVITTALQRAVPPAVLGRVTAITGSLGVCGVLLGNALAPLLLATVGLQFSLVAAAAVLPLLAAVTLPRLGDLDRRAAVGRHELADASAALRGSGLVDGAPTPVLERLAAAATPRSWPAGAVLMRAGDRAAEVFVLTAGSVEASAAGRRLNLVTAPGYVGELGVLHDRERTATVTATTAVSAYAIPATAFLDAVRQEPALPLALRAETALRLGRTADAGQ